MDLNPQDSTITRRLAMHHISARIPADSEHYSLIEKSYGHLVLRIPKTNASIIKTIKAVTKLDLPTKPLSSTKNDEYSIFWISPDEFLLLVPEKTEYELETQIRQKSEGHFAIIDLTGGQTVLELCGERAEVILKKSTPYDVHLSNFSIGKVVTSVFAKSQALIVRNAENHFQLIVRRSFSDYLWQWIVDAGSRP